MFVGDSAIFLPIVFWKMLTCVLRTHVKEHRVKILSKKLCQFIILEIEN